jgi:FMN-dependent NADH-azoreductase
MTALLYVESSPRGQRSHSSAVSHAFIDAYLRHHPDDTVDVWDLWSADSTLIEFDGDALTAKYAARGGNPQHSPGERSAWAEVARQTERLKRADRLLLSVPLWNFGVPYKFKHWVDVVTQPGLSFRPDPVNGPQGLLTASKALLISARGGVYTPGTPNEAMDLCTPYVRRWLWMVGIRDLAVVGIEGTGAPEASVHEARARAIKEVQALAPGF